MWLYCMRLPHLSSKIRYSMGAVFILALIIIGLVIYVSSSDKSRLDRLVVEDKKKYEMGFDISLYDRCVSCGMMTTQAIWASDYEQDDVLTHQCMNCDYTDKRRIDFKSGKHYTYIISNPRPYSFKIDESWASDVLAARRRRERMKRQGIEDGTGLDDQEFFLNYIGLLKKKDFPLIFPSGGLVKSLLTRFDERDGQSVVNGTVGPMEVLIEVNPISSGPDKESQSDENDSYRGYDEKQSETFTIDPIVEQAYVYLGIQPGASVSEAKAARES